MSSDRKGSDIPIGFGMALMENKDSMKYFSSLSKENQEQIINKAKNMKSRDEMHAYVQSFANKNGFMG